MKRILSIFMSLVLLFGVCVVGAGCFPKKETEAEYKARIRKELDEIPIEATGYKLVHSDFPKPYKYFDCSDCGINATIETDDHFYDVNVKFEKGCDDESYGFEIAVDNGAKKSMSFNYDNKFKTLVVSRNLHFMTDRCLLLGVFLKYLCMEVESQIISPQHCLFTIINLII